MCLSPTIDMEHHHVCFLGNLILNLWDCRGQDTFYESYFEWDWDTIIQTVELLIYIFNIKLDCRFYLPLTHLPNNSKNSNKNKKKNKNNNNNST